MTLHPPKESAPDDESRLRQAAAPAAESDRLIAELERLALAAVEGQKDVDLQLATLLAAAGEEHRDALAGHFRARVQALEAEREPVPAPELTPQQQELMRQLQEHERMFLMHVLSEKAREKIRRMLLLNPPLIQQIVSLGEQLYRRGVFMEMQKVTSIQLGSISAQPVRNAEQKKEPERER